LRREASIDCRRGRRSDSRLLPLLLRVTPSAASEHFLELLGCPISWFLATCCVCLELRSLPSAGITRLQRYYRPLRHPSAPGLSLTGVRLIIPDHALGLPVLRALSLCTCRRQYPGAAAGRNPRSSHPAVSAFPDSAVESACTSTFSRFARRSLVLRPAHSRGHQVVTAIRRLQPFRYLHDCSDCFRPERIAGWALHPLESAALSRRTPIAVIGRVQSPRLLSTLSRPSPSGTQTAKSCGYRTFHGDGATLR
jgi:hypothetical protein